MAITGSGNPEYDGKRSQLSEYAGENDVPPLGRGNHNVQTVEKHFDKNEGASADGDSVWGRLTGTSTRGVPVNTYENEHLSTPRSRQAEGLNQNTSHRPISPPIRTAHTERMKSHSNQSPHSPVAPSSDHDEGEPSPSSMSVHSHIMAPKGRNLTGNSQRGHSSRKHDSDQPRSHSGANGMRSRNASAVNHRSNRHDLFETSVEEESDSPQVIGLDSIAATGGYIEGDSDEELSLAQLRAQRSHNKTSRHGLSSKSRAEECEKKKMKDEIEMLRLALEELQSKQEHDIVKKEKRERVTNNQGLYKASTEASPNRASERSPKRKTHSSVRKQFQRVNASSPRQGDGSVEHDGNDNCIRSYGNNSNQSVIDIQPNDSVCDRAPEFTFENNGLEQAQEGLSKNKNGNGSKKERIWRHEPPTKPSTDAVTNRYQLETPRSPKANKAHSNSNNTNDIHVYQKKLEIKDILESIVNGKSTVLENKNPVNRSYSKPNREDDLSSSKLDSTLKSDSRLLNADGTYYTMNSNVNIIQDLPTSTFGMENKHQQNKMEYMKEVENLENSEYDGFNIDRYLKKNTRKAELFENYNENKVCDTLLDLEKNTNFDNSYLEIQNNTDFIDKLKTVRSSSRPSTTIASNGNNVLK